MTYDLLLRSVAGLAAVGILGAPVAAAVAGKVRVWIAALRASNPKKAAEGTSVEDMRIVLDLASRLRTDGNVQAVHLCQQLLDVMLAPPVEVRL